MGQYSWLIGTRNAAESCKINWAAMNKDVISKSRALLECYEDSMPTLMEVAKRLDDTKLMGYLGSDLVNALVEFNKHLVPYGSVPRIDYDYEGMNQVWALEFIPGESYVHLLKISYNSMIAADSDRSADYKKLMSRLPEAPGWSVQELQ